MTNSREKMATVNDRYGGRRNLPRNWEVATHLHLRGKLVMSRRSIVSLAASLIVGSVCVATISTDASAYYRRGVGVYHGGVYRGGVYRGGAYRGAYYRGGYYGVRPGVAVGAAVGAAAVGAAAAGAYYAPRCGYYPYGPCY
jgi:hypothetical protein